MRTKTTINFLWGGFAITLAIILLSIVGYLARSPYPGFLIDGDKKTIARIFDQDQQDILQVGDQIISINGTTAASYRESLTAQYWQDVSLGDSIEIELLRDGQQIMVTWNFTGQTKSEFRFRFFSPMWVAIILWGCSASAYLTVHPRDHIFKIFLYYCIFLAVWLGSHYGPAEHHLWFFPILERFSAWLLLPLGFSFTWQFPYQLREDLSKIIRNLVMVILYLIAAAGFVYDIYDPAMELFRFALLAGSLVGIILIISRFFLDPISRNEMRIMYFSAIFGYPTLGATLTLEIFNIHLHPIIESILLFGLLLVPILMLFAIWANKIPKYQFRPNRYLASMLFSLIALLVLMMMLTILESLEHPLNNTVSVLIALLIAVVTTQTYPLFEIMVDRYIFKIPISSKDLLRNFSQQLNSTKDTASISTLMGDLILPSLMVRQSALIELEASTHIRVLDIRGVNQSQIPDLDQIQKLLDYDQKVFPPQTIRRFTKEIHWIKVVLPLVFDDQIIGVWLLGQRDPNDRYDAYVVDLLQALAQQTSIALINYRKSHRLRTLYKANIDRDEEDRARLARNLHDDTLNDLALLQRETNDPVLSEGIDRVISSLRKAINGLRPEMLSYGLETALNDLGDALTERQSKTLVDVQLDGVPIPIAANIEQHLYRIVQQACENALRHAQASRIRIIGIITEKAIHLTVADDGIGFNVESTLDFSELISKQHFGIAGMQERADLIGAQLEIESDPIDGTRISVFWNNPKFIE